MYKKVYLPCRESFLGKSIKLLFFHRQKKLETNTLSCLRLDGKFSFVGFGDNEVGVWWEP